jgi:biopolymer transport protein ExbD
MAMSTSSGGGVASTPNVTPMIDVMLVLLIIFMVVTPMLMAGFNAEPPIAQNIKDHPEDEEHDQVFGIDRDGNYYLNKKPIAQDQIGAALHNIYVATQRDDAIMYLKADKNLEYSKVIDAMDIAMKNGVRVVGMISDQKPGTISSVAGDTKATAPIGAPAHGAPAAPPGGEK